MLIQKDLLNKLIDLAGASIEYLNEKDIEWITVKGTHIPIKKGENKEKAIKAFWETKGKSLPKESKDKLVKDIVESDNKIFMSDLDMDKDKWLKYTEEKSKILKEKVILGSSKKNN